MLGKDLEPDVSLRSKIVSRYFSGPLGRVILLSVPAQKWTYIGAGLSMMGVAAATAASAWIMQSFFDAVAKPEDRGQIWMVAGAITVIFLARGLFTFLQAVLLAKAGNRVVADIQTRIFAKLMRQDYAFFSATESSDILMRLTQGATAARAMIDQLAVGLVRDLLTFVGLVSVMLWQHAILSLMFLVIGPLAAIGLRLVLQAVRRIAGRELASIADVYRVLQESAAGIRIIKAFALEDLMNARMVKAVRETEARANAMTRVGAITVPMLDILAGMAIAAILLVSTTSLLGGTVTSPGQLMSFVAALLMAYDPARRLSQTRVQIEGNMAGVAMIFDLMDRPEPLTEAPDAKPLPPAPLEITFDAMGFAYGDKVAIHPLTLTCAAGKTTAFVGPSGSGKSTLLNLILRLQDPTTGVLRIGGLDLRQAQLDSLRGAISYVGQETFLFSTSLMENIRLGRRDATDAEVIAAAKVAQAHEFIDLLPAGYQTPVGENGAFLSGGQKQRIAIARAVLKNAPILVLDEATSALDNISERGVRDGLAALSEGRTTIVVAHRLSTIQHADRICFLEGGRVVEDGTFDDLLAKGGKFRALHDGAAQDQSA
ncbi:ABC transporter ATP-binding protein/permease [Rhodobacter sp. KR11]|uniref:ABC transporter ATP-binding protein n=1 Tax=Rhodobacter sp. KR11 TaxID=2974588 RepID=UPI0022233EDA|nr:ABC transporter ATP-binding protein [Rhodobacter sp. KR11]MCW1919052.1 ABC transporter ATP-binding protein/permease [Rhodobacter sp. KR11]